MTVLPLIHFAFKRLSTSLSLCLAGKPTSYFTKIKSSTRRSDIEVLTQSYIARLLKHPVMTVICIVCRNSHHQHNILRIFLTLQSIIISVNNLWNSLFPLALKSLKLSAHPKSYLRSLTHST